VTAAIALRNRPGSLWASLASLLSVVYETGLRNRFMNYFEFGMQMKSPGKKNATIRDVAAAAGVSVTSVSRHLNGQITLPDRTVASIEQAVSQLGYRPNALARRLTHGRSETLGLITADIAYPLFAAIASAAEAEAARHGYSMVMFNSRNIVENELAFLSRLEDREVDGILLLTNHFDDGRLVKMINRAGHVVLLDEDVPGAKAPRLFAESRKGAILATRHLIENGHRRIAVIGGPRRMLSTEERILGFKTAMADAALEIDPALVVYCDYVGDQGMSAFQALMAMEYPPTAIFTFADMLALGAMRAARDAGISIPDDVSLVSFDDISNADLLSPALTTISQSATAFGMRGVNMLLDFISGRQPDSVQERIDVDLVIRNSVGAPRRSEKLNRRTIRSR